MTVESLSPSQFCKYKNTSVITYPKATSAPEIGKGIDDKFEKVFLLFHENIYCDPP